MHYIFAFWDNLMAYTQLFHLHIIYYVINDAVVYKRNTTTNTTINTTTTSSSCIDGWVVPFFISPGRRNFPISNY